MIKISANHISLLIISANQFLLIRSAWFKPFEESFPSHNSQRLTVRLNQHFFTANANVGLVEYLVYYLNLESVGKSHIVRTKNIFE